MAGRNAADAGEMMSRLVSDLFDISELAHHGPENLFISLLKITGSFLLLLFVNVELTAILFAVTVIMVAYSIVQNRRMRAIFMDNRRKIAGVNARLQDSLAENRTTIVIAHRLSTIRRADEIIVIGDDGIAERGAHDELLAAGGIYARYYRMQFDGLEH